MPLPSRYVREIHARLAVRYGSAWSTKWAGLSMEAIEADWADQLDGMRPENIRKALDSLPLEFPPTAPAFRALGSIREEARPAAALPPPDRAGLLRIASSLAVATNSQESPVEWMARLERDVKAGNASRARIEHYRIAVKNGYYGNPPDAIAGPFVPPPADTLPPGMRRPDVDFRGLGVVEK